MTFLADSNSKRLGSHLGLAAVSKGIALAIGLLVLCGGLSIFGPARAAQTSVSDSPPPPMVLPGSSTIDAFGAFSYSIPLAVPPGTADLSPVISLDYSSRGSDGLLGLGWGLRLTTNSHSRSNKSLENKNKSAAANAGVGTSAPSTLDGAGDLGVSAVASPTADPYPHGAVVDFPAPMARCPRTIAQDSVHGSVNYDANDRFCLNGKRLILTSGIYGADGSQYRTEIEEFSKIIAHGQTGSGPLWFEVHTKSGQTLQYGNTSDSRAPLVPVAGSTTGPAGTARVWAVNRISDVQGNYLNIIYNGGTPDAVNGQIYPTEIDYTGNPNSAPAVAPYNHVYFYYNTTQTRPDVVPMYEAGSLSQTTVLLTDIKTYEGSALVQEYKLAYNLATSNATHDELASVTLCDSGGACIAPTSFGWQGSRDRLVMTAVPVTLTGVIAFTGTTGGSISAGSNNFTSGDFNGDGIEDMVIVPSPSGGHYSINTYLGTGPAGGFGSALTTLAPANFSGWPLMLQSLSIDGDGLTDIFYEDQSCTTNAHFYKSNGNGLFTSSGTASCYTTVGCCSAGNTLYPGGDLNGDGFADYIANNITTPGHAGLVYTGNGAGVFAQLGAAIPFGAGSQVILTADFDGDGCSDKLIYAATTGYVVQYSCNPLANSTTLPAALATGVGVTLANHHPFVQGNNQVVLGDFNGDGRADVLIVPDATYNPGPTNSTLYLSTGTGFAPVITIPNSSDWYKYYISSGDWNGDSKTDLLLVVPNNGHYYGTGTPHQLWLSVGTGFAQAKDASGSYVTIANTSSLDSCTSGFSCINALVSDWNNDGAQDFILNRASGNSQYVFSYVPELMSMVSNGVGNTRNVTYDRLNKNGVLYTKCPNAPATYMCGDTYPMQALDGAFYVVSRVDASNGMGTCTLPSLTNCYSTTYAYGGLKQDLAGRGLLGFQQKVESDLQTGIISTTNYLTAFPYAAYVSSTTEVTTAASTGCTSGVTLNATTNTPGAVNFGGTRNFVYTSQSVVTAKDCNGAALPTITTSDQYDCQTNPTACYGELDTSTVSRSDGSSEKTTKVFADDAMNWCFDRPTSVVINGIVGSSNIARNTSRTWTSCLLTQETIEPGSSTLQLQTTYTPDAFGNIKATAVTGSNIASRGTATSYDSRGEFPVSTTDELGHVDTYTHDPRFGGLTSHVDPNTVSTTWNYDSFGRLSKETRPDGTQTQVVYAYCAGVNGGSASCPTHGAFLRQATPTASDGTTQIAPASTTQYDMLSRRIATDSQGFDGSAIRLATPYDALGRIAETSRPYFLSGGTPQWTVNTYDALARVTLAVAPNGGHTTTAYNGLSVAVTNANSQTTTTVKNAEGQIASVTDAMSHTTAYVYDAFDDLTSVTDPAGNLTSYTYDIRGHNLSSSDPDLGHWTYTYDALGELTALTDAKSQHSTLSYDVESRLVNVVEPDLTSTWTYDTAAHGIDKLASATTNGGYQRAFTYDALSRPILTTLTSAGSNYSYSTTYNATNGQIGSITYPSGLGITYVYTSLGYLSKVNDSSSGQAYWTINGRDAELHLTKQTFGNGVVQVNTLDPQTGLLTSIRSGASNGVAAFDYQHDLLGNVTYRADDDQGIFEYYCLDSLNRLTTSASGVSGATVANCTSSGTNIIDKTIGYDALGDIVSKSDVGTYSYPAAGQPRPHAVSSITGTVNGVVNPAFSYDLNGNMTGGAGRTITYTSYNMTSAISSGATNITFAYDSEHARIQQVGPAGTTTYLNDPTSGAMSEHVANGSTVTWNDYILGPNGTPERGIYVAERPGTGSTMTYFTVDHLGSIAVIANTSAGVTERDSYDAWGRRRNPNGTDSPSCSVTSATTRGFTGQEMLDAVCAVDLNARIYDPTIGRFTAADPITATPYDLQSLNRYSYVGDDPGGRTDPTGLIVNPLTGSNPNADADVLDDLATLVEGVGAGLEGDTGIPAARAGEEAAEAIEGVADAIRADNAAARAESTAARAESGVGKPFTRATKAQAYAANRAKNGGELRSDKSGQLLTPPKKSQKGVTPPRNEAQLDHITPRSKGGTNDISNAQVLSGPENRTKSDRTDPPPPPPSPTDGPK
jgi:RHS repeat-associated protein